MLKKRYLTKYVVEDLKDKMEQRIDILEKRARTISAGKFLAGLL